VDTTATIIGREIGNDGLLRIMATQTLEANNQVILYAEKGDLGSIQRLYKEGKDVVNCRGLNGFTPLHHACNRGHALVAAELLRLNALIDSRNDNGETPLHLAVYAGNILIVDQLLDFGADVNARNKEGETCLFYAARKGQPAIIRLLLQRGADAAAHDDLGETAAEQAANANTAKAFQTQCAPESAGHAPSLQYSDLLRILSFLNVNDTLRCACVCSKWHRVTSYEEVWQRLGVRKWELALQNSLGFAPTATMSFYRPSRRSSKDAGVGGGSAKQTGAGGASGSSKQSSIVVTGSTDF
jgi:hypothetical protein